MLRQHQLRHLHTGTQQDRQVRHVAEFQHHGAAEPRVDEAGGGVHLQAEAAEAALAVDHTHDVVGAAHHFGGVTERELTGMQHEHIALGHDDRVHQLRLLLERIDVGEAAVAHHPELGAEAHVDAGRLHERRVVRVEQDAARTEEFAQGAVGEDHGHEH